MKNKTKQRISFALASYLILSGCIIHEEQKEPSISYYEEYNEEDTTPFACINGTCDIYIGTKKEIKSIRDDETADIYVIDERDDEEDPNMQICNSYEITKPKEMQAILKVLLEYEKKYPSLWNRTLKNMKKEWIAHNICYYLNYETKRTEEVDLNNDDEDDYENNRIIKLLKKK